MTAGRCMDCGAEIAPPATGRPRQRCDAHAGAHRRRLDNARSKNRPTFKQKIWWGFFQNALVSNSNLQAIPPDKIAADADVPLAVVERAMRGESITRKYFRRLCKWLRWPEITFVEKQFQKGQG